MMRWVAEILGLHWIISGIKYLFQRNANANHNGGGLGLQRGRGKLQLSPPLRQRGRGHEQEQEQEQEQQEQQARIRELEPAPGSLVQQQQAPEEVVDMMDVEEGQEQLPTKTNPRGTTNTHSLFPTLNLTLTPARRTRRQRHLSFNSLEPHFFLFFINIFFFFTHIPPSSITHYSRQRRHGRKHKQPSPGLDKAS